MIIKLPVSLDPLLSLLPRYAHPLSILLVDKSKNLPYLLNDFGRLAYDQENEILCNPKYDWMYTGCGALTYECGVFPADIMREPLIITNFITAMLQNGRYCIIDIDEFFCEFSAHYNLEHKNNGVLIFGVDTVDRVIFINCYSDDIGYKDYKVDISEFLQAVEYMRKKIVIHCFKENKHICAPIFDKATLIDILKKYECPDLDSEVRYEYCYDSTAIRMLIDRIQSGNVTTEWIKSALISLREHKVIMQTRILSLCKKEQIDYCWYSAYNAIYHHTENIYDCLVQYEKTLRQTPFALMIELQRPKREYHPDLLKDISRKLLDLIDMEERFVGLLKNNNEGQK